MQADLGYQGFENFTLSQTSNFFMAFSDDCKKGTGTGSGSCEKSPDYATNYWNESYGSPISSGDQIDDSGYVLSANLYSQDICVYAEAV